MKISKIISGHLVRPLMPGEPAWIHRCDGLMKTSTVIYVNSMTPAEIRFETVNTKYVLKIHPTTLEEVTG